MTADRRVTDDYRCMACGGLVGETSRHCLHCDIDLGPLPDASNRPNGDETESGERTDPSVGTQLGNTALGVVAGFVLAGATFLATMIPLGNWALLATLVAWVGGTVAVSRQDTIRDGLGLSVMLLAVPALVFPLGLAVPTLGEQLLTGRFGDALGNVAGALMATLFISPLWGGLGFVGWLLRR